MPGESLGREYHDVFDNGGMYYIYDTIKSEINIKFNIHLLRLSLSYTVASSWTYSFCLLCELVSLRLREAGST
jgi:hypothetical protein